MRIKVTTTRLDRPWHRPGAVSYALARLPGLCRPPVTVFEPAIESLSVLRDLPVVVRDGTTLRVNVVRQAGDGRFPVLVSAHPWSTGAVGMIGVSYLAMSQWKAAALQPPGLKAICPWEGFTDAYRDLMRPGGIRETGFVRLWGLSLRGVRQRYRLTDEQRRHPLRDDFWHGLVPALEHITAPALICGSFSDNNLHSRGSIRAFERISSADRYLYTHRGGKWATFYSAEARAAQLQFFDRYLRGRDVPAPPRVRLEVRERRDVITSVREEDSWPLARTQWTPLYLTAARLAAAPPPADGRISFGMRSGGACFDWTAAADTEITGPMALRLWVQADGA